MRRLPGETSGEKLTQNTFKMADCLTTRHDIGGVGDTDKGTPGAVIKSGIIGVCTTAAATVNKVVTLSNFSDFELLPGMEILVFFKYGNTASNPTLNVYGTGAKLIKLENQASGVSVGSGAWEGGTWQRFQYAKVTVDETVYDNWLMIGNNIAQKTSSYTIYADGRIKQYIRNLSTGITTYADTWEMLNVTFPIQMPDTNYVISISNRFYNQNETQLSSGWRTRTVNGFELYVKFVRYIDIVVESL